MDQELVEYLDRRFKENEAHLETTVERIVEEKIGGLREETGVLREGLDELRSETGALREGLEELRSETEQQFRQTHVMIEDLRGDLQTVAEGVIAANEQLAAQQERNEQARQEDRALLISLFKDNQRVLGDHETRLNRHAGRLARLESARA